MAKMKIHWFEWACNFLEGRGDSYTNAPGLVTCKQCIRKLERRRTRRAIDEKRASAKSDKVSRPAVSRN